ncbi:MAG: zf-HC2 domain-containing protein [Thermomicrobiales bacterium]
MADPQEMACQELVRVVSDYLEGALPDAERTRLEHHLAGCEGCRRYVYQMRTTIRLSGTLSVEQLDPAARSELLQLFRDWNQA